VDSSTMMSEATDDGALDDDSEPTVYSRRVGARLRSIRRQMGHSLLDVERISEQEFKASVLGAYERGERAISVPRLHRLAVLYGVPVDQLLPPADLDDATLDLRGARVAPHAVKIDLIHLENVSGSDASLLQRYLSMIQVQRQDFNGRVLTIRRDDLGAIACILGCAVDAVEDRLEEMGLRLTA
jgi:transcriptional regulator with XRE-family HTH domain